MKDSKLTKEFEKGLKHFYDCINFADSNLDADAIRFMNEMPGRLVSSHNILLEALKKISDIEDVRYTHCGFDLEVNNIAKHAIAQAVKLK